MKLKDKHAAGAVAAAVAARVRAGTGAEGGGGFAGGLSASACVGSDKVVAGRMDGRGVALESNVVKNIGSAIGGGGVLGAAVAARVRRGVL